MYLDGLSVTMPVIKRSILPGAEIQLTDWGDDCYYWGRHLISCPPLLNIGGTAWRTEVFLRKGTHDRDGTALVIGRGCSPYYWGDIAILVPPIILLGETHPPCPWWIAIHAFYELIRCSCGGAIIRSLRATCKKQSAAKVIFNPYGGHILAQSSPLCIVSCWIMAAKIPIPDKVMLSFF